MELFRELLRELFRDREMADFLICEMLPEELRRKLATRWGMMGDSDLLSLRLFL